MTRLSADDRRAIAWAATTIYERAAEAQRAAPDARARTLLTSWTQAFAPGDRDALGRRLAWDRLNPELVGGAVLADPPTEVPAWTDWLVRFEAAAHDVLRDLDAGALPELADLPADSEPPFVELWMALLGAARSDLGLNIHSALERQLLGELSVYGDLAAYELFKGAGDYRAFIAAMLGDGLAPLWKAFPVVARQLALIVERWTVTTRELVDRFRADRAALEACFNGGAPLGEVEDVVPGLSDPHDGRHRVSILRFTCGTRIVYKPRDLAIDDAFAQLACWFADRGLDPAVPAVRVLRRAGYGWCEYVEREDFPDRASVSRYYERAGALLFLAHLLGARDLHMENVVARSAGPTLIDLELLLQPASHTPGLQSADADAGAESCLRTGLLTLFELGPNDELFDLGGLRGTGAAPAGIMTRQWKDLRTDQIRFVDAPPRAAAVANAVVLDGRREPPEAFPQDVLAGFDRAYEIALAHRDELMAPTGPLSSFAGAEVRVLVRPTNQYAVLSAVRNTPRYQRDGLLHSLIVDGLHRPLRAAEQRPREWPVVVEERRAIDSLDVPRFYVRGDGRTLCSHGQPVLRDYYGASPLDAVRDRVARLSGGDGTVQRRLLARAVTQSTASRFVTRPPEIPAHGTDLVTHALWVAAELLAHATERGDTLTWVAPDDLDALEAHSLYDGAVGPGLFFAALAAATADSRWRAVARQALAPTIARIEAPDVANRASSCTIGGCSGLGSLVHALARAGALLDDERLLSAAFSAAELIDSRRIAGDRHFDVVDGSAGALLGILALNDVRPDESLVARAIECGDHLVSHIDAEDGLRLAGYAHGAAGIGAALMKLSAVTGVPRFRDAAARAFDVVASLFGANDGNWPVSKPDPANVMTLMVKMNAWCHGAPGIAVAALSAHQHAIAGQAQSALETVERWGAAQADHLCCGHLGRADALLTAGEMLGGDTAPVAREIAARVLTRARERRHFRLSTPGVEYTVFAPGFYRGLSGIGYELLRLASPRQIPSILFFGGKGGR